MKNLNHKFYPTIVSLIGDKMSLDYIISSVEYNKINLSKEEVTELYKYVKPIVNEEKKRLESLLPRFELRHKDESLFTGSENECYIKLQRTQSQSTDWAMKHEGYTITPKES